MALHAILFEEKEVRFTGLKALNKAALDEGSIKASTTGGNLCLVQAGIGTIWQLDGKNKIILLEEVGERGYRIDRMFEHMQQASLFKEAAALVLGDFSGGLEPDGSSLVDKTLKRFAKSCPFPVVQIKGIGHEYSNFPIPLGTMSTLTLGRNIQLHCSR
jgi:muramoyltetrapeptide carboxypeptidase